MIQRLAVRSRGDVGSDHEYEEEAIEERNKGDKRYGRAEQGGVR
jgi:hypothetical protein